MATGGWGGIITWEAASGRRLATHPIYVPVSMAYDREGTRIVSSGNNGKVPNDGQVDLWDAETGARLLNLKGHQGDVDAVAFLPNSLGIVTAGEDGTSRLWDATTGLERQQIRTHESGVVGMAVSPDGRSIATVTPLGPAKVWDLATGRELLTVGPRTKRQPMGVGIAFDREGKRLAFAGDDNQVLIVTASDGRPYSSRTWLPGF